MFSVIIPTLGKNPRIHTLIESLDLEDSISEIVLINNAQLPKSFFKGSKIRLITPEKNLYVNPSWNLGVSEATGAYIALCNDDISFDASVFRVVRPEKGDLIGLHGSCYGLTKNSALGLLEEPGLTYGFGCLMFLKRSSYPPIPETLRIWYGDNYLVDQSKRVFKLLGLKVETEMSSSSSVDKYLEIIDNDRIAYTNLKK